MNITFTGHRPNKIGGYDWNSPKNQRVMLKIHREVENIIMMNDEVDFHFIFGGALGIDQMAFSLVNILKNAIQKYKQVNITMEIAIPFKNQPNKWFKQEDKDRYNYQMSVADKITYVDSLTDYMRTNIPVGEYNPTKLQIRNEYMVDNADLIIAIWDGSKSGTANCVNYAKKLNKEIIIINPKDIG